jgi:hypothetical protein
MRVLIWPLVILLSETGFSPYGAGDTAIMFAPNQKVDFSHLTPRVFEQAIEYAAGMESVVSGNRLGKLDGSQQFLGKDEDIFPCVEEIKMKPTRPKITIYEEFHGEPQAEKKRTELATLAASGKAFLATEGVIAGDSKGATLLSKDYNRSGSPSANGIYGLEDGDLYTLSSLRTIFEVASETLNPKPKRAITEKDYAGLLNMIFQLSERNPTLKTLGILEMLKSKSTIPRKDIILLKTTVSTMAYRYAQIVKGTDKYSHNQLFDPEAFNFTKLESLKGVPSIVDNWNIEVFGRDAAFARNVGKAYCEALKAGKELNIVVGAYHSHELAQILTLASHLSPNDPCYQNEHNGMSKACNDLIVDIANKKIGASPLGAMEIDIRNPFVEAFKAKHHDYQQNLVPPGLATH